MRFVLGVHLQILLAVGLAAVCFCLVLGCIICWRRRKSFPLDDKEAALSQSAVPAVHLTLKSTPCVDIHPVKQQYEELEGDVLEYPSSQGSSAPSEYDLTALPSSPLPELRGNPKCRFPLRRLSSPVVPSVPFKSNAHGRASLPSMRKLGLVAKTRRALDRRSTVTADNFLYSRSSGLTRRSSSGQQGELSCTPHYGSSSNPGSGSSSRRSSISSKPPPILHFSLLFSPAGATLTVTVTGLFRGPRRLGGVAVQVSLPPACPASLQGSIRRRSLGPEQPTRSFVLQVGSVEQLRCCTLKVAVTCRDFSGLRETALGELELACADVDWQPDTAVTFKRELSPSRTRLRKEVHSVIRGFAVRWAGVLSDALFSFVVETGEIVGCDWRANKWCVALAARPRHCPLWRDGLDARGHGLAGRELARGAEECVGTAQTLRQRRGALLLDTMEEGKSSCKEISQLMLESISSQEAFGSGGPTMVAPRALGQLLILLQYQTPAHRIKVMLRKAESLAKLNRIPGTPDHYVIINLRNGGSVISTRETKAAGGPNAVWNAPFLFDLPAGDISQLPLVLEFIVMQGRVYTKTSMLGRVLIGHEGSETGRGHWKEMCNRGQVESSHWHALQREAA